MSTVTPLKPHTYTADPNPLYSVETYSGRFVDLENPHPDQFDLESIAAGLGKVNRFTGGSQFFYTVAEHAYWVSKRLEWLGQPVPVQFAGLHHDDAEYVLNDLTTPFKRYIEHKQAAMLNGIESDLLEDINDVLADVAPQHIVELAARVQRRVNARRRAIIRKLEKSLMVAIVEALGFSDQELPLNNPAVKQADLWAVAGEARIAVRSGGRDWHDLPEYDPHPDLATIGLSSERASHLYLERHYELVHQLDGFTLATVSHV